jgi:hypothetical protein
VPVATPKSEEALQDLMEKYAPGEQYGSESTKRQYGKKLQRIPEKYRDEWRSIVSKLMLRDMYARIEEVKRSADGGFYWRNIFDACWSDLEMTWLQASGPANGSGPNPGGTTATYPLNIYLATGRAFVKIIGHKPDVHFTASGESATAYRVKTSANYLLDEIESINADNDLFRDFARVAYTDGRYGIYTRWVTDGARFGYYDQDEVDESIEGIADGAENPPDKKPRQPRGGEVMTLYGVPWLKVPINLRNIHEFPYLILSDEIDISAAKSLYPDIAKKISAGEPGPAEYMFDRSTRIALTQGIHLLSQMAEAFDQLPTRQMVWVRSCIFSEIEDDECREWFENTYPDGAKVVFVGNEYAESCNESMDDHWSIGHATPGHGQATPAYGFSMLADQDAFCNAFDLEMETHMRAIPASYGDPQIFDFPSRTKQKAEPGAFYPLKHDLDPNIDVNAKVWTETPAQVSQALQALRMSLLTDIPTALTGISPAAIGEADENNTTLGGIQILREASRGEAGTAFTGFIPVYAKSCEQAVRIGAYYRMADADENGRIQLKREGSNVLVDLVDLRIHSGTYWCKPDTDQTYPNTLSEKQLALVQLSMRATQGDEQAKNVLTNPANDEEFTRIIGLPNIHSANHDIEMKVQENIRGLLKEIPQPIQQAVMGAAVALISGQAPPDQQPDPYKLNKSSRKPSPLDNAQAELAIYMGWRNSPAGQREKDENPNGFLNVELYTLSLQQIVQQAAQAQADQAIAPQMKLEALKKQKVPSHPAESIAFKDLGPSGKMQLAAQAGLDVSADEAANTAEDAITPPQPRKLKRAA